MGHLWCLCTARPGHQRRSQYPRAEEPWRLVSVNDINICRLAEIMIDRHGDDAALSTEYIAWSYESEVRLIHHAGQSAVKVAPNSITEITFGCRMPERHRKALRNLVSSRGLDDTTFDEVVKSNTDLSFSVLECTRPNPPTISTT